MYDNFLLMKNDTKLRFDGVYICNTLQQVVDCLLDGIPTSAITANIHEVKSFNDKVDTSSEFASSESSALDHSWKIPPFYQNLDVFGFVLHKFDTVVKQSNPLYHEYMDRLSFEMEYFENTNSLQFIQCIVFLLDELRSKDIFWGVGRGSSCASLVLYLIGLHKIDPVRFEIPISDFFK